MSSEKYAARRGSVEEGMHMITACFARAPQRSTSRTYMHFLLMFQKVRPIIKTRNQLYLKGGRLSWPSLVYLPSMKRPLYTGTLQTSPKGDKNRIVAVIFALYLA